MENPKNGAFEAYKKRVKSTAQKKASNLFDDKTFGDEWQLAYTVTSVLKSMLNIASSCTVAIALYFGLKPMFGDIMAGVVGVGAAIMIEWLKNGVWSKLAKFILKYKTYTFTLVFAAIVLNLSSIGGSVLGAWLLPTLSNEQTFEAVAPVSLDSINTHYSNEIAKIDLAINKITKEIEQTTSDYTKVMLSKTVKVQTEQKNTLIEQRNTSVTNAEKANDKNRELAASNLLLSDKESEDKKSKQQTILVIIAVAFEVIIIVCSIFESYYLFRVDIDNEANQSESEALPTQSKAKTQSEPKAKQSEAREEAYTTAFATKEQKRIGFGNSEYQHGQIIMEEGSKKPKIAYEKANGELTFYTQAKLLRMANADKTSDANRKKLLNLANKTEWNQYQ